MKKKMILCTILILLFTGGIVTGVIQLYRQYREYSEGTDSYTDLDSYVELPEEREDTPPSSAEESESGGREWPSVDFASLQEINPDIVGWIYVEGTDISYPVVQRQDNQYYLNHLFSGETNSAGCIFLDCRNASGFSDWHSIIYGHHMKNGSMFSRLTEYKKQEYYDGHPTALLLTPDENFEIEIFAGYVASVQDKAWEVAFPSDRDFSEWLEEAKERSCFDSEITPAVTDRILTLSTCSYEFDNARFVLLGILKPEAVRASDFCQMSSVAFQWIENSLRKRVEICKGLRYNFYAGSV